MSDEAPDDDVCETCGHDVRLDEEVADLYARLETERRAGAEEERARIVAYLRAQASKLRQEHAKHPLSVGLFLGLLGGEAYEIENGYHLTAQSREGGRG